MRHLHLLAVPMTRRIHLLVVAPVRMSFISALALAEGRRGDGAEAVEGGARMCRAGWQEPYPADP